MRSIPVPVALGAGAGDYLRGLVDSEPERAKGILRQLFTGHR